MLQKPPITIGMAVMDDFDGAYFTIQALRLYHPSCQIVVIDNNPDSPSGRAVAGLEGWIRSPAQDDIDQGAVKKEVYDKLIAAGQSPEDANRGSEASLAAYRQLASDYAFKYIPFKEVNGTSAPRNKVFEVADSDSVMCIDSHVMLWPGSLDKLIDFYAQNPDTQDLYSGPMVYDNLKGTSNKFDPIWRGQMYGIWGTDPKGESMQAEPFEIPGMGLGLFTCRKNAWLGFNAAFRGFGGEELYIHEKFRRAGHRAMCLPFLRWLHRFGRPNGLPYANTHWDRVRNYVIGFREVGFELDSIHEHFVKSGILSQQDWNALTTGAIPPERRSQTIYSAAPPQPLDSQRAETAIKPEGEVQPKAGCSSCGQQAADLEKWNAMTLGEMYIKASTEPSDINEHCDKLRELASQCLMVTEFGMRHSVSTVALLAGVAIGEGELISYNPTRYAESIKFENLMPSDYEFREGSSLSVEIDPTSMLFIDTKHTADHVWSELSRHAKNVHRWIVLHDTKVFGETGEDGGPGILPALRRFMREKPEWSVVYHTDANNGLTVLSCWPEDKPRIEPGLAKQAFTYAASLAKFVAGGSKTAGESTVAARLDICAMCDHRTDGRCSVCGCYLEEGIGGTIGKALMPAAECPLGKWPE